MMMAESIPRRAVPTEIHDLADLERLTFGAACRATSRGDDRLLNIFGAAQDVLLAPMKRKLPFPLRQLSADERAKWIRDRSALLDVPEIVLAQYAVQWLRAGLVDLDDDRLDLGDFLGSEWLEGASTSGEGLSVEGWELQQQLGALLGTRGLVAFRHVRERWRKAVDSAKGKPNRPRGQPRKHRGPVLVSLVRVLQQDPRVVSPLRGDEERKVAEWATATACKVGEAVTVESILREMRRARREEDKARRKTNRGK